MGRLGSEVTVVEFMPSIGGLGIDVEVSKQFLAILKKQGMKFELKTKVTGVTRTASGLEVATEAAAGGDAKTAEADVVLVCVGRRQFVDNLGLDALGVEMEGRKVKVDHQYRTNIPSIFAIGDIVDGPMLAHKAEDEVAWVGKTEEMLKDEGVEYKKGNFTFGANSRAKANMEDTGFFKVLACKKTDKLLGVHIVQGLAGELIGEACIAIEYGASTEDIARVCHAHPTLSEALKGACQKTAFGKAINSP